MMRPEEIKRLLKASPFEPVRVALADGRSVLIRHPDQVVVADRHLLVGLAKIERSRPMATPTKGEAIAKDWLILNLLTITAIEPEGTANGRPKGNQKRKKE